MVPTGKGGQRRWVAGRTAWPAGTAAAAAAAAAPPGTDGTAAADTAVDFVADLDGLLAAVHRLTAARRSIGLPHVDPQIAARALLDALPPELPHTGAGGRGALETLAGPALEQVSRL